MSSTCEKCGAALCTHAEDLYEEWDEIVATCKALREAVETYKRDGIRQQQQLAKLREAAETYEPLLEGEADDFDHSQWRNAVAVLIGAARELVK